jgi:hypothetical protein
VKRFVDSTAVRYYEYDPQMSSLDIEYKNGNLYRYLAVPQEEYDQLEAADSKGTYINQIIKKHRYIVVRRQIA